MGGGTVTADTITREEFLRTLQASNVSSSMIIPTIHSNSALHTQRLPTCPASQVFTQVSLVFFHSLMRCGSASDSPMSMRCCMGTPTQLPRPPLSSSGNSDLHARKQLLFTSGAIPAMPHVPNPQLQAPTGGPLV
jgi:hypothetical protein